MGGGDTETGPKIKDDFSKKKNLTFFFFGVLFLPTYWNVDVSISPACLKHLVPRRGMEKKEENLNNY